MNPTAARIFSCFIRDKKLRHIIRDTLMNGSDDFFMRHIGKDFYGHLHSVASIKSLHEYVDFYKKIGEILTVLTPYTAVGGKKVRIGGNGDGGYVMLDPGRDGGVAYSLGVSPHSPWDIEMAQRGYNVFQFDGTIEMPPDMHPNLHFQKVNIVSSKTTPEGDGRDGKSLERLFQELGHEEETDIILQMDIEGGEWDVLSELSETSMKKFKQIIIELHDITPVSDSLPKYLKVLEGILRTHKPIHVHLNNALLAEQQNAGLLFYSDCWEVTYVRASDYVFEPCTDEFPTPLDSPNVDGIPDIALGHW